MDLQQPAPKNWARKRFGLPLICKVVALCGMVAIGALTYSYSGYGDEDYHRELRSSMCREKSTDEAKDNCPDPLSSPFLVIPLLLAIFYLFVGIAIVCDEFFVPALEEIGRRWDIKDDVAGATLMAAGGSAPELASSLIGTFSGSDIGFGTIVGSAVFNVLFVIACCVAFTPKEFAPLKLTGWPLARDCIYYCVCLAAVAIVFGVNTPGVIELWESIFLFMLYIGYCTIMYYNEDLYDWFHKDKQVSPEKPEGDSDAQGPKRRFSLVEPSQFQVGFLALMASGGTLWDTAGWGAVYRVRGDVKETFDKFDENGDGKLCKNEVRKVLEMLNEDKPVSDEDIDAVMRAVDTNKDGEIDFTEFTAWYTSCEQRLKAEEKEKFYEIDTQKQGYIKAGQVPKLLKELRIELTGEEEADAMRELVDSEDPDKVTYENFSKWYEKSPHWTKLKQDAEEAAEDAEGIWNDLMDFPKESTTENVIYIILAPLTWPLALTCGIKDVRVPGNEGWAFYQFFSSIFWIGAYSYVLVDWVSSVGTTLHIPAVVMGLTLLAAGTSVPDLLSSVVVAKKGLGDMAVSSSVGSNIFDVTVGLPVPWMLFNIIMGCPVQVGADNLLISIIVLNAMVLCVVLTIMVAGWQMSKFLGVCMLLLYFVFLIQDIVRVYMMSDVPC